MSNKRKFSIKKLESCLQDMDGFSEPKVRLEQYATPPHIAATLLHTIHSSFDDFNAKLVADLGCGTGRLALGSILCGAEMVYGFDIDSDALRTALENIAQVLGEDEDGEGVEDPSGCAYRACRSFNLVQADIASSDCDALWESWRGFFDTVIMNPPFGTKQNAGLDMKFLKRAIDMSSHAVYSLHKTSTRSYILGKSGQWGVEAQPIAQIRYNLENTFKFHKRTSVNIDVDLWRIKCN